MDLHTKTHIGTQVQTQDTVNEAPLINRQELELFTQHTHAYTSTISHSHTHAAQRLPRNLVSAKSAATGREWLSFHKVPWTLSITQTPHSNTQFRRSDKQNPSNINGKKVFSSTPVWPFPTSRMSPFLISLTDYQTITRESFKTVLVARGQYSGVSECNGGKRPSSCAPLLILLMTDATRQKKYASPPPSMNLKVQLATCWIYT